MLAGGRASRFGGDKAAAVWRGRPLLEHALATLKPWCEAVAVVGRDWPGHARIDDRPRPDLGPLGGIAGALKWSENNGFDSVLTIACDTPEVPSTLLRPLAATVPSYCPDLPVLGHWPAWLATTLIARLDTVAAAEAGALSVRRWAQRIDAAAVPAPAPLRNINFAADLAV